MAKQEFKVMDLIGSLSALVLLIGAYYSYKYAEVFNLLVFGSVANTALSGTITVPKVINDSINISVNSVATHSTTIGNSVAFVLSLVSIVILIKVFYPFIGGAISKIKSKKIA